MWRNAEMEMQFGKSWEIFDCLALNQSQLDSWRTQSVPPYHKAIFWRELGDLKQIKY